MQQHERRDAGQTPSGTTVGYDRQASFDPLQIQLEEMGVAQPDIPYATALFDKYRTGQTIILDLGRNFLPSAVLDAKQQHNTLGLVDYRDVASNPTYADAAANATLTVHTLDAGLGTNLGREDYLQSHWDRMRRQGQPRIGSKGTDIHIPVQVPGFSETGDPIVQEVLIPVTELKVLRMAAEATMYRGLIFRPVVNTDSAQAVNEFLASTHLFDHVDARQEGGKTYIDHFQDHPNAKIGDFIMQGDLPTIDVATGLLTTDRKAPGSHGQIGAIVLQEIATQERSADSPPSVRVICNGDGPNNFVSPEMVGFVLSEQAGVVMVTTTKTPLDLKGGLIGMELTQNSDEQLVPVPQLCELAQARKAGWEEEFYATGLSYGTEVLPGHLQAHHKPGEQSFNTNTAIFNEGLLATFLPRLREVIGEDAYRAATTPDLIENKKEQNGRQFVQLEGALGSVLLNLNRCVITNPHAKALWEEISGGNPFLRIINVDEEARDEFFTPTKYASDVVLYTATDHFGINMKRFVLENVRPGHLPRLSENWVQDPWYMNLTNAYSAIGGTSMINLDELDIDGVYVEDANNPQRKIKNGGRVVMAGAILQGTIRIVSAYDNSETNGVFDLNSKSARMQLGQTANERLALENVFIYIDQDGKITTTPIINSASN